MIWLSYAEKMEERFIETFSWFSFVKATDPSFFLRAGRHAKNRMEKNLKIA